MYIYMVFILRYSGEVLLVQLWEGLVDPQAAGPNSMGVVFVDKILEV
jgi:hypothetical protein